MQNGTLHYELACTELANGGTYQHSKSSSRSYARFPEWQEVVLPRNGTKPNVLSHGRLQRPNLRGWQSVTDMRGVFIVY